MYLVYNCVTIISATDQNCSEDEGAVEQIDEVALLIGIAESMPNMSARCDSFFG